MRAAGAVSFWRGTRFCAAMLGFFRQTELPLTKWRKETGTHMQIRIDASSHLGISGTARAILCLMLVQAAAMVHAQVRIPDAAFEPSVAVQEIAVQEILDAGKNLERDRRWGDALAHYENALSDYPGRRDIEQRLTLSRIHFDLARRYADSSFVGSLNNLNEQESLDLYSELLIKINAHYFQSPNWQRLVRRGTNNVIVALTDPVFVEQHLTGVSPEYVAAFRQELARFMESRQLRNRQEARMAVGSAGRLAGQRLRLNPSTVIMEYVCGAAGALDDYSAFLTPAQLDDVYSQIEGNFVGLGIELKASDGYLLIVNVLSNSPAYRSGIRSGDRITEVDGQSTRDVSTDQAADMLKGEEGSIVSLAVLSSDDELQQYRVRRQQVDIPSVEDVRVVEKEDGIAYLRLTSFQKTTSRDVDAALWELHRLGMRSLIIDVRDNPGGLLSASVEVADKFVNRGTIVATRGRSPREDFDYKAHSAGTWPVPLIVLVDRDSASASEIFVAAIRDHRRGVVVGQRSYGKGSVQGIFPLNYSSAGIRLTTARFFSPNGQPISKQGVDPDVVVRETGGAANDLGTEHDDPVLAAGIQAARHQLATARR